MGTKEQYADSRWRLDQNEYSGKSILRSIIRGAKFRDLIDAVAATTLFASPETVRQTKKKDTPHNKPRAVFRIIRGSIGQRGTYGPEDKRPEFMYDDNKGPTDAFIWAHDIRRGNYEDIQFNHIWDCS